MLRIRRDEGRRATLTHVPGTLPVVVLAEGPGTLPAGRPDCLVDVNGSPFVVHQLRRLRSQGARRVIFCPGHLGGQIVETLGDGSTFGLTIQYAFDDPRQPGNARTVKQVLGNLPGPFFAIRGDTYVTCPLSPAQAAFSEARADDDALAMMTVVASRGRGGVGHVAYTDGRIVDFDPTRRTPAMAHVGHGLGVFHPKALDLVPEDEPFDLDALYGRLLSMGKLAAFETVERSYEVGSPSGLAETRRHLSARRRP